MNIESSEPISPIPAIRHDGWTGEAMAKFLETLAATGIVIDACDAASKSSTAAYALRRRDPLFAKAWELALGNARDRLADTLLARSIEGNVEQIIKDGVIVAEKHFIDNRLGLAVLKRLDKRTDEARSHRPPSPRRTSAEPDWDLALTALRSGNADDIAAALVMIEGDKVDKVDTPESEDSDCQGDSFDHPRIWRDFGTEEWRTNYPPPPGFSGFEQDDWEGETYCRALSKEEHAALVAAGIAEPLEGREVTIESDEAERDAFFASLTAEPANAEQSHDADRSDSPES